MDWIHFFIFWEELDNQKVNKEAGKTLSTNDFTNDFKNKLSELYTKNEIDLMVQNAKSFTYNVNVFADLPTTNVRDKETGWVKTPSGVFLINRKPAGAYLYDGTKWVLSADYDNILNEVLRKANATDLNAKANASDVYTKTESETKFGYKKTWMDYNVSKVSATLSDTTNGTILTMTYADGVKVYRFIPNPYEATKDIIYATYTNGVLSGELAKRTN